MFVLLEFGLGDINQQKKSENILLLFCRKSTNFHVNKTKGIFLIGKLYVLLYSSFPPPEKYLYKNFCKTIQAETTEIIQMTQNLTIHIT